MGVLAGAEARAGASRRPNATGAVTVSATAPRVALQVGRVVATLLVGSCLGAGIALMQASAWRATDAAAAPAGLLVQSNCHHPITLSFFRTGDHRAVASMTAWEPGTYRVAPAPAAATVLGTARNRRPLAEFPLGPAGELLVPPAWCDASSAGTGVGLGGPLSP